MRHCKREILGSMSQIRVGDRVAVHSPVHRGQLGVVKKIVNGGVDFGGMGPYEVSFGGVVYCYRREALEKVS